MLQLIESVLGAWTGLVMRLSWFVLIALVALTGVAGWYAVTNLKVNTATSEMLDPNLVFQVRARELKEAFPEIKTDVSVVISAPTLDEADAFTAALRERVAANPEFFNGVFSPTAETFFQENGLLYLETDELESRLNQMSQASSLIETLVATPTLGVFLTTLADNDALAERSELGAETLQDIYAELAEVIDAAMRREARPFSWMGAIDTAAEPEKGYLRVLYTTPTLDYTRLQPAKPAISALRAEIDTLNETFGGRVDAFITGDPALREDELRAVTQGIEISLIISIIAVGALLLMCFRSVPLALATLTSLIMTLTLTSAFAALTVGSLNLVSVAFTVLLVGLGLDFAIHLLLHIQEHRDAKENKETALRGAIHEVGPGLALAAVTTSVGFLAFVPTEFDGIAQLGVIAGGGVVIAFLVTITLMPAILGAFDPRMKRPGVGAVQRLFKGIERVAAPVAVVMAVLGVAAATILPQARFDADPMALRDPASESVRGVNLLFDDPDTVPYRLTRVVSTREEVAATKAKATALETVRSARALPDFIPENQDEKLELIDFGAGSLVFALDAAANPDADVPVADGVAKLRARLDAAYTAGQPGHVLARLLAAIEDDPAMLTRIEENVFQFWPQLVDRLGRQLQADYVTEEDLPPPLVRRYLSEAGQFRVDIVPEEDMRDRAALDRFVDEVSAAFPDIGGGAVQSQRVGEVIALSMLQATGIALALILVILLLVLRRVSDVALMMFPLMLAAILTTAAGVVFDIPFNYANVIVLPLLLGIGVDSGIHLVMQHRHVEHGHTLFGTTTPRAVLFSAMTTVASFGSLILSSHRGTASMGELLSIAIAFTLICMLIVLPAAISFRDRLAARKGAAARQG